MSSSSNNDLLYTPQFENYISDFNRVCSGGETTIQALSPIIELLRQSEILDVLMKDPSHQEAKSCLQSYISSRQNLPQEFVAKFFSIVNLKINLTPNRLGFFNQSYNAKVVATNIRPPTKITNLTIKTRQDQLRQDMKNPIIYNHANKIPPQVLKLKYSEDLLPKCINSMADLHQTIKEGNRSNGYEIDDYIKTNLKH